MVRGLQEDIKTSFSQLTPNIALKRYIASGKTSDNYCSLAKISFWFGAGFHRCAILKLCPLAQPTHLSPYTRNGHFSWLPAGVDIEIIYYVYIMYELLIHASPTPPPLHTVNSNSPSDWGVRFVYGLPKFTTISKPSTAFGDKKTMLEAPFIWIWRPIPKRLRVPPDEILAYTRG